MESKKQTAVDQLRDRLLKEFGFAYSDNIHEELKAMEKEHMKSTYIAGRSLGRFADPEDYYTSTYE
jgi:hypothetical protein